MTLTQALGEAFGRAVRVEPGGEVEVRYRLPRDLALRAVDEAGNVQPTRATMMAARGANYRYHYNAIQSWNVTQAGEIGNVYV